MHNTEDPNLNIGNAPNDSVSPKRFTVLGVEIIYILLLGIGFAFLGWFTENLFRLISAGDIDSRYHILPFISPYGLIPLAFHLLLLAPDRISFFGKRFFKTEGKKEKILSNLIAWALICALVFVGELAVGNLWDICFGVELWDHSFLPLNVAKYTSVVSTFGFGTGVYLLFTFVYTPALRFLRKRISYKAAKRIVLTLGTAIVLDTVRMMACIILFGEAPIFWEINLFYVP